MFTLLNAPDVTECAEMDREAQRDHPPADLERVRRLVADPDRKTATLAELWLCVGIHAEKAWGYARSGLCPSAPNRFGVRWTGAPWQLAMVLRFQLNALREFEAQTAKPEPKVERAAPVKSPESAGAVSEDTVPSKPTPAPAWDAVPKAIARDRRLSPQAVLVYLLLLQHSNNGTKVATVTQEKVARWMGLGRHGRDQVRKHLQTLEAHGYIKLVSKGQRIGTVGKPSRYQVRYAKLSRGKLLEAPVLEPEHDRAGRGIRRWSQCGLGCSPVRAQVQPNAGSVPHILRTHFLRPQYLLTAGGGPEPEVSPPTSFFRPDVSL
jgi:hypothetical protein